MITKSIIIAGSVSALMVLTAGCSGNGNTDADAPASVGTDGNRDITIALAVEPVSLDPCDSQDATNAQVMRGNIIESVTRIDPLSGDVVPGLAESWEALDDRSWRLQLRQGVTFHDGEEFNAEAVAAAIARIQDPDLNCQNFDELPYPLETTVVDEHTLELVSAEADPILPLRLSWVDVGSPAATPAGEKVQEPVGTGPYRFVERNRGQSMTIERFNDYWGEAGDIERATFVYRSEPVVRAGMVTSGEADIAVPISAESATDDDRTRQYNDNRVFFLRTQTDRAPFEDPRAREAVQLAIDKESIVGSLMERIGEPTDQMVAPTVNAYIEGYEGPAYDPEAAQKLLEDVAADGFAVDVEFDLVTRPDMFPGSDEVIQAIGQNLKDVGFNVNIVSLDTEAWLQLLRAPFPPDQKPTIVAASHDNITGDASFTFNSYVSSEGPNSTVRNEEIDALLAEAGTAQGERRAELYQEASRVLYEEVHAIIPVAEQSKLLLLGDGVEYEPNGLTGIELRLNEIQLN